MLTAIEDFMAGRDGLRLAIVPAFFGLGVLWHEDAAWAGALAAVLAPLDRNPLLVRMESNRVAQLVTATARGQELGTSTPARERTPTVAQDARLACARRRGGGLEGGSARRLAGCLARGDHGRTEGRRWLTPPFVLRFSRALMLRSGAVSRQLTLPSRRSRSRRIALTLASRTCPAAPACFRAIEASASARRARCSQSCPS